MLSLRASKKQQQQQQQQQASPILPVTAKAKNSSSSKTRSSSNKQSSSVLPSRHVLSPLDRPLIISNSDPSSPPHLQRRHHLIAPTNNKTATAAAAAKINNNLRRHRKKFLGLGFALLLVGGAGNLLRLLLKSSTGTSTSTSVNIPSSPHEKKNVTVVLMNHARPGNLQQSELLPLLLQHAQITQVLILHSNPTTAFDYQHPKVQNINATLANQQYGLSLRFYYGGLGGGGDIMSDGYVSNKNNNNNNDWIMMIDDDMLLPLETLEALLEEFASNPNRIVGRFGRSKSSWRRTGLITHGYNTVNWEGPSEVVLTKVMVLERTVCAQFHTYADQTQITTHELLAESKPYWNGEDIFMSLVANHIYSQPPYDATTRQKARTGTNNYAMPWLPVGDVGDAYKDLTPNDANNDVSGNFHGIREPWTYRPWNPTWRKAIRKAYWHLDYRGRLWNESKRRLAKLA